jgi:hypothetical protein
VNLIVNYFEPLKEEDKKGEKTVQNLNLTELKIHLVEATVGLAQDHQKIDNERDKKGSCDKGLVMHGIMGTDPPRCNIICIQYSLFCSRDQALNVTCLF